jgi:hypothetical protein
MVTLMFTMMLPGDPWGGRRFQQGFSGAFEPPKLPPPRPSQKRQPAENIRARCHI